MGKTPPKLLKMKQDFSVADKTASARFCFGKMMLVKLKKCRTHTLNNFIVHGPTKYLTMGAGAEIIPIKDIGAVVSAPQ